MVGWVRISAYGPLTCKQAFKEIWIVIKFEWIPTNLCSLSAKYIKNYVDIIMNLTKLCI